jgi:hydrogenase expression/formation protein HypE
MHRLIGQVFLRYFNNPFLRRLEDAAEFKINTQRLALTTDSYVVQPLFFPGGDIGKLAVCGTVNDLAVKGARPRYLSAGFIISTGMPLEQLERICRSMANTARRAGVQIVTGDTKVIERSNGPELYINTSGVGTYEHRRHFGAEHIRPGDKVLINGSIGDHEAAIVLARGQFEFPTRDQEPRTRNQRFTTKTPRRQEPRTKNQEPSFARLASDCAPLNGLIVTLIRSGAGIRMMRDPTRGGVATTLNEVAEACGLGIIIDESALLVKPAVQGVCALLGFEPLYLASEGRVLVVVAARDATRLAATMRRHSLGRQGARIAEVSDRLKGVWLKTRIGSLRPVLMLEGLQLPRIC